jgi:hypothetical protein
MRRYAANTTVPSMKSRMELERVLANHGASSFAFGWNSQHDTLQFGWHDRTIRFTLPKVDTETFAISPGGRRRSTESVVNAVKEAERQRWRALLLVVKAKLEAVEVGIAIFEQEFLAFIVTVDGQTVGDVLVPQILDGKTLRLTAQAGPTR